jgi:hypothetical protein
VTSKVGDPIMQMKNEPSNKLHFGTTALHYLRFTPPHLQFDLKWSRSASKSANYGAQPSRGPRVSINADTRAGYGAGKVNAWHQREAEILSWPLFLGLSSTLNYLMVSEKIRPVYSYKDPIDQR